jgi:hypothetical protein
MTKKSPMARMNPEFRSFLKLRATNFRTSIPKEQESLMEIMKEVEKKIGIDFMNSAVTKKGVNLQTKRRITLLK